MGEKLIIDKIKKKENLYIFFLIIINFFLFFLIFPRDSYFIESVNRFLNNAQRTFQQLHQYNFSNIYFWLTYRVFELNPFFYHLTNAIFHLLNVILVYLLGKKLTEKKWVGFIAALLFSVHYMNAHVIFIVKRTDELGATALGLLSILFYNKFFVKKKAKYYIFSLILFYIAAWCRLSVLSIPLLLLVYTFLYTNKGRKFSAFLKKNLRRLLPFFFPYFVLLSFIFFKKIGSSYLINFYPKTVFSISERITHFLQSFPERILSIPIFYKFIFIPFDFQSQYSFYFYSSKSHFQWVSFFILVSLIYLFVVIKNKQCKFLLAWFLITPLCFLYSRFYLGIGFIKEKYLYFPLVGGCLLVALLIEEVSLWLEKHWKMESKVFSIYLIIMLMVPHAFSLYTQGYYRRKLGAMTKKTLEKMEEVINSSSNSQLFYFFLPHRIYRYQYVTGIGDLANGLISRIRHKSNSTPEFIYCYISLDNHLKIKKRLYSYLGIIKDFPVGSYCKKKIFSDPKIGIDSYFPVKYDRNIFYYNNKIGKIEKITNYVYPGTKVKIKFFTKKNVNKLYIKGNFNGWKRKKCSKSKKGYWEVSLSLQPGTYKFFFINNKGEKFKKDKNELNGNYFRIAVVNQSLPVRLFEKRGSKYYDKIIKLKRKIRFSPRDLKSHRKLATLYRKMGFWESTIYENSLD